MENKGLTKDTLFKFSCRYGKGMNELAGEYDSGIYTLEKVVNELVRSTRVIGISTNEEYNEAIKNAKSNNILPYEGIPIKDGFLINESLAKDISSLLMKSSFGEHVFTYYTVKPVEKIKYAKKRFL